MEGQLSDPVRSNLSTPRCPVTAGNTSEPQSTNSPNTAQLDVFKTTCVTGGMCRKREKKTRKFKQLLSSSRDLCLAYRHYVFVRTDKGKVDLLYANPDCLACSVDVAEPQILHTGSVCSEDSHWTTPATTNGGGSGTENLITGYMHQASVAGGRQQQESFSTPASQMALIAGNYAIYAVKLGNTGFVCLVSWLVYCKVSCWGI